MMPRLESVKSLARRWFSSIPFFVVLALGLGALTSTPVIPKPTVAVIPISSVILNQAYVDDVLDALTRARDERNIKAIVLQINSPGGGASATEQIYLDVLRLRQQKPVVASVGTIAASGGYYIATASNLIYGEPTSLIGSIGVWSSLPEPEELDEEILTSGLLKSTGFSRRKAIGHLEMVRQGFVEAVVSQRGDRLKLSEEELSLAELYLGIESYNYGLIDEIGTITAAIEKAASLANIRNYEVVKLEVRETVFLFFTRSDLEALKSRTGLVPAYYYLYFESE